MGSAPDKLPPNNARGFFDSVASSLHGEVVTGNLDAALSDNTSYQKCAPPSGKGQQCFVYREPPSYAKLLKTAGFTVINVANNHSLDAGYPGLADTKQALRNAGLDYTGAPNQITLQRVSAHDKQGKPITVAVLGFSSYSWGAKVTDIPVAQQLVRSASQQADVVVVNMQAGAEGPDKNHVKPGVETYLGENRGDEIAFSHAVVDAGADLVIGHGPQVLRGMQWYHGRLIAYSLGKLASYRTGDNDGASASGAILTVTLHADGSWGSGKLTATQLTPTGLPALDPQGRAHTVVGRLSTVDFASQAVRVDDAGGIAPPAP